MAELAATIAVAAAVTVALLAELATIPAVVVVAAAVTVALSAEIAAATAALVAVAEAGAHQQLASCESPEGPCRKQTRGTRVFLGSRMLVLEREGGDSVCLSVCLARRGGVLSGGSA